MIEIWIEIQYFWRNWEKFKKTGFSQKWRVFPRGVRLSLLFVVRLGTLHDIYFFQISLSHTGSQGVDKHRKTPFWGISWPLTSQKKIFFILIWKSAYRSNETFISRTHSLGCVNQTCSGGGYRQMQDRLLIPLRVTVLIWWTDVPPGAVRRWRGGSSTGGVVAGHRGLFIL